MLKWKKEHAGRYKTKCGRFEVRCNWRDLKGSNVFWTLHCVDRKVTLDDRVWGRVESFETKREAQECAVECDEKPSNFKLSIRPMTFKETEAA